MKRVFLWVIAVLAASHSWGNSFVSLAENTGLPLPSGWRIVGTSTEFPVAIINDETGARMLVFRTLLPPDERIGGADDFRMSVNRVLDSVVMQLPDAILLTSTGSYEEHRAQFVIEFSTADTLSEGSLRHRLAGILYRHPDGHQLLYNLWGQAGAPSYAIVQGDFETMQTGFRYSGPHEENVFTGERHGARWGIVFVVGLGAVYFIMRQRRRQPRGPLGSTATAWQCPCGRTNHLDSEVCRHCGRPRVEVPST